MIVHSGHDLAEEERKRLDDRLNRGVAFSVCFHVLLTGFAIMSPTLFPTVEGTLWGDPSGGMSGISVGLATSVGGIELPRPEVVSDDAAGNDSPGFYEDVAPPPAEAPEEPVVSEAEPIAETPSVADLAPPAPPAEAPAPPPREPPAEPAAPTVARTPVSTEASEPRPDVPVNAIPFGDGGQPNLPVGTTGAGEGTGATFRDGAFGEQYGSYVSGIRRRIADNWLQTQIDRSIRSAPRAYIAFDIMRDGTIENVRVERSSGNRQVDTSARRAVLASNPLSPLPREYRGTRVSVSFWFELSR